VSLGNVLEVLTPSLFINPKTDVTPYCIINLWSVILRCLICIEGEYFLLRQPLRCMHT